MKFTKYIILIFIIPLYSQFGKNIVQYEQFNWQYIQTKNFDIEMFEIQETTQNSKTIDSVSRCTS